MKTTLVFLSSLLLATSAFASAWEHYKASYEVPVPAHLKSLATFKVDGARARESGGLTELRYTLPLEVTGREIEIRLRGQLDANGNGLLESDNAKGVCVAGACALNYKHLDIQPAQVRDLLVSQGHSGLSLEQRLEVAAAFRSGDPAGILHLNSYP